MAEPKPYTTSEIIANGGWTAIPHEITGADVGPTAKVVLVALRALFVNGATWVDVRSKSIVDFTGLARNSVRTALRELETAGIIAWAESGSRVTINRPESWSVGWRNLTVLAGSTLDPARAKPNGQNLTTTRRNGQNVTITAEPNGQILTITNPDGQNVTITSGSNGQNLTITNGHENDDSAVEAEEPIPSGSNGQNLTITNPDGQNLTITNGPNGQNLTLTPGSNGQILTIRPPANAQSPPVSDPLNTGNTDTGKKTRGGARAVGAARPSDSDMAVEVAGLRSRYPDAKSLEWFEQGLAGTRKSGVLALSILLRVHRFLAAVPVDVVEHCIRTYNDRFHGDKDERYFMGIVRGEVKRRADDPDAAVDAATFAAATSGPFSGWSKDRLENAKKRTSIFAKMHFWFDVTAGRYVLTTDRARIRTVYESKSWTDQDYEDVAVAFSSIHGGDKRAAWAAIEAVYKRVHGSGD